MEIQGRDADLVEYTTGSAYTVALAGGCFTLDADGMLAVPDRPGLGITLDAGALARYTGGNALIGR